MSRSGRYTRQCADSQTLEIEAKNLWPIFQEQVQRFQSHQLHPAELVGNYLCLINQSRKKSLWVGNSYQWFSPISENNFLDFWGSKILRGIPQKVNSVLINWYCGHYPLTLTFDVPSDYQMLEHQALGKRYVTLFIHQQEWIRTKIHQRDHFSFTLHDLLHAHEFFSDNSLSQEQTSFYKKMLPHYDLLKSASKNPTFQEELSYLLSDLNTHPAHLNAYLESLWKRYQLPMKIYEFIQNN